MTGAGGFTGTGAMGAVDRPMGFPAKALVMPKKKDRKTAVREAAHRVVDRLLNDEQDSKTIGTGAGVGRHA